MIYDPETNRWYLNEFHLKHCKARFKSNEDLQNSLPLSQEEADASQERWSKLGQS